MSRTAPRTANARHTSSATRSHSTGRRPGRACTRPRTASTRPSSTVGRVGDVELAPGFTSYWAHLHVQTYDVTELLVAGDERVGGRAQRRLVPGPHRKLAEGRQLRRRPWPSSGSSTTDGAVVASGPAWRSATGPIRAADLMAGQFEDRRVEPSEWAPVAVVDHDLARLTTSPAPPTRRVRGAAPGRRHPASTRPPGRRPRPEHQRLGAPHRPRPGGDRRHAASMARHSTRAET